MAGAAVRETVTLAGLAERTRVARAFVGGVLGPGHPCGDDAERGGRIVTWFEIQALLRPMQHSAVSGKGLNSPDVVVSGS